MSYFIILAAARAIISLHQTPFLLYFELENCTWWQHFFTITLRKNSGIGKKCQNSVPAFRKVAERGSGVFRLNLITDCKPGLADSPVARSGQIVDRRHCGLCCFPRIMKFPYFCRSDIVFLHFLVPAFSVSYISAVPYFLFPAFSVNSIRLLKTILTVTNQSSWRLWGDLTHWADYWSSARE